MKTFQILAAAAFGALGFLWALHPGGTITRIAGALLFALLAVITTRPWTFLAAWPQALLGFAVLLLLMGPSYYVASGLLSLPAIFLLVGRSWNHVHERILEEARRAT